MEDTALEMLAARELLNEVEWSGAVALRQLIRQLDWPEHVVMMALGELVRQGLVQVTQRELEVVVELMPEWSNAAQSERA